MVLYPDHSHPPTHTHTGRLSAGVAELARNLEGGRSEELLSNLSIFAVHVLSFTRFDKF